MRAVRGRSGRGGASVGRAMVRSHLIGNQSNSIRRLQKDYAELRNADVQLFGVSAAPLEDSMYVWHADIRGPKGTKYEGGVFHFEITFSDNYPCSAPNIRLFSTIPHPNVFGNKLCLDMLERNRSGNWYEGWCSMYTIESILI
jgi:ubiquitin-protein ligase